MSSGSVSPQEAVLRHIATYGLTIRPIVCERFCEGSARKTENLVHGLLKQKHIAVFSLTKKDKYSFYTLSAAAAATHNVSAQTGRLSARTIETNLAVLWFCLAPGTAHRYRTTGPELEKRLGVALRKGNVPYIVQAPPDENTDTYAARVIVPGSRARPDYAIKVIHSEAAHLLRLVDGRAALEFGVFRFIVLVHSIARLDLFTEAIERARRLRPQLKSIQVDVAVAPIPTTLKATISETGAR